MDISFCPGTATHVEAMFRFSAVFRLQSNQAPYSRRPMNFSPTRIRRNYPRCYRAAMLRLRIPQLTALLDEALLRSEVIAVLFQGKEEVVDSEQLRAFGYLE